MPNNNPRFQTRQSGASLENPGQRRRRLNREQQEERERRRIQQQRDIEIMAEESITANTQVRGEGSGITQQQVRFTSSIDLPVIPSTVDSYLDLYQQLQPAPREIPTITVLCIFDRENRLIVPYLELKDGDPVYSIANNKFRIKEGRRIIRSYSLSNNEYKVRIISNDPRYQRYVHTYYNFERSPLVTGLKSALRNQLSYLIGKHLIFSLSKHYHDCTTRHTETPGLNGVSTT